MEKQESSIPPKVPVSLGYQSSEGRPPLSRRQVVTGCLITIVLLGGLCFVAGFTHVMADYSGTAEGVFLYFAAAAVGVPVWIAHRCRRNEFKRGWGVGIYLGLGLVSLFWGYCGIVLYSGSL
jgi:hypothetical protein